MRKIFIILTILIFSSLAWVGDSTYPAGVAGGVTNGCDNLGDGTGTALRVCACNN